MIGLLAILSIGIAVLYLSYKEILYQVCDKKGHDWTYTPIGHKCKRCKLKIDNEVN